MNPELSFDERIAILDQAAETAPETRGLRKVQQGVVHSNKMDKTITVVVERRFAVAPRRHLAFDPAREEQRRVRAEESVLERTEFEAQEVVAAEDVLYAAARAAFHRERLPELPQPRGGVRAGT